MIHRFGWGDADWDKLASGTIAGHIIECGAQSTGGNCQVDWQNIPDMANIGYPIVEAEPDGTFVVTKHPGTGGRVHSDVVKEQLLYELGDPKNLHHARLRGRFHHHSAGRHRSRPRSRLRHPRPRASGNSQAFHQLRRRLEVHRNAGL